MAPRTEIVDLLIAGRYELSHERSRRHYNAAATAARAWAAAGGGTEACVLGSEALKELAFDADVPVARTAFWKQALQALSWVDNVDPFVQADEFASLAVDIFQDQFATLELSERERILRKALVGLDGTFKTTSEPEESAFFLARKSAILRHLALLQTPQSRVRRLREAQRAARRSVELHRAPPTLLEQALSDWAVARHERNDEAYASSLRRAEAGLLNPALRSFEPAEFALARFYRLTFRALDACDQFRLSAANTRNRRRLCRESPIYAEAAIQLWYAEYPDPIVFDHLAEATETLESALAAGYQDARTVIDLAFLQAIQGGVDAGVTALVDIHRHRGEMSWQRALSIVAEATESDLPALGFALGIESGSVLTRLGTFASQFLPDTALAEALYRAAVSANAHDPIALTNLARFLVHRAQPSDLREARRLIQTAQNFSDRRFRWWRVVLAELDDLDGGPERMGPGRHAPSPSPTDKPPPPLTDLKRIKQRFRQLAHLADHQGRGYELEKLLHGLASITFGTAASSYRFERPLVKKTHQVDAFIDHRGQKYRCECKWQKNRVTYDDLVKFIDKLDVVGVSGLFASMSGFDEKAIGKAREVRREKAVLLMEGSEVAMVMEGRINFDELLTIKRSYFDQRSEPYHPIQHAQEAG